MTRANIQDIYPLSPMQRLFWVATRAQRHLALVQFHYRIEGPLDVAAFARSWAIVAERHEALRTAIISEGLDEPVQVVYRSAPLPVVQEDWSAADPERQRALFESFLARDRGTGIDLAQPPLMRCAFFRVGDSTCEFIWTLYRGLLDGWSVDVLWDEVWRTYEALGHGVEGDLAPARPYRDFIIWLKTRAPEEAERFWSEVLRAPSTASAFPPLTESLRDPTDEIGETRISLPQSFARTLQETARDQRLTLNSVIVGAFCLALARLSETDDVVVGSTVAGRPLDLAGAESIVGMFMNNLPVRLKIDRHETLAECLQRLQQHQAQSRDFEHVSVDQIQQWIDTPSHRLYEAIVVFQGLSPTTASGHMPQGIRVSDLNKPLSTTHTVALTCIRDQNLALHLDYDRTRCTEDMASGLLTDLKLVLHTFSTTPDELVGAVLGRMAPTRRPRIHASPSGGKRMLVAPRSGLEIDVLGIWCRVLGVRVASMNDDFFESGGNSVLALHLFDELAKHFGKRIPLGSLFTKATPAHLASVVAGSGAAQPVATSLVTLRAEGTKPPLFLIHGIGGEVFSYLALGTNLDPEQPVYGVQAEDSTEELSIEQLAARYIRVIKTVAPEGPYLLGGFCGGATLAFEMAQQLQVANEPVPTVAIIDQWLCDSAAQKPSGLSASRHLIKNLRLWISDDMLHTSVSELAGRFRSRARTFWSRVTTFLTRAHSPTDGLDIRDVLGMWRFPDSQVPMLERLHRAFSAYVPKAYPGRVAVFKPRALPVLEQRFRADLGWGDLAQGGVDVHVVPGSHATLLKEPLVRHLATALQRALDEATTAASQSKSGAPRALPSGRTAHGSSHSPSLVQVGRGSMTL